MVKIQRSKEEINSIGGISLTGILLIPDIELNLFWTNLHDSAEKFIRLYYTHGASELF